MRGHLHDWGVERVALQPLGVDTALFHPGRAAATPWRSELGLAADARVLVYAGRFAPEKHLDVLADAVARLGPPHVLLAIGAGPMPPAGERVRVVPFVADATVLAAILAGADAFVHAGDQETFGLSALEAMACGTPIVVRRRGRPRRARRRRLRPGGRARHRGSVRRSDRRAPCRRSAGATPRRAGARRGQRLGAGAARTARSLPAPARGRGGIAGSGAGDRSLFPAAGAMSQETTITPSRFESERFVCLVLHDVAPSTRAACMRVLAAVAQVADVPVTLLAVPRYHGETSTPDLVDWLGARERRGDELALHGWSHRDEEKPPTGMVDGLRRRVYTRGEGEFWALSEREASRRIEAGVAWFREHGWPLAGFVAPAWLLGPGAWQALATQRFEYTATLRELVHLPGRASVKSQSVVYSTCERLAAAKLAALERDRRPAGTRQQGASPRAASARRRFRRRPPFLAEGADAGIARPAGGDGRRFHAPRPGGGADGVAGRVGRADDAVAVDQRRLTIG